MKLCRILLPLLAAPLACSSNAAEMMMTAPPAQPPPGGNAGSRGDESLLYAKPPEPALRVELVRSATGTLRIVSARAVVISRTVPSLGSELAVTARSGSTIVSAAAFRFPDHAIKEGLTMDGAPFSERIELTEARQTVYLPDDEPIDRLQLEQPDGTVLDTLPAERIQRNLRLTVSEFEARFPNVRVVGIDDHDFTLPDDVQTTWMASLTDPTSALLDILADGFDAMTPTAVGAVRTVAFYTVPYDGLETRPDGVVTFTYALAVGAEFYVNSAIASSSLGARGVDLRPDTLSRIMVHEASHCYANLVEAAAGAGGLEQWPSDVAEAAVERVSDLSLSPGLESYLAEIQSSAVEEGLGLDYQGDGWVALSDGAANEGGFATPYGSSNPGEDIAELASAAQLSGRGAFPVCSFFAGQGPVITREEAVAYTKLLLLRYVGLVSRERFEGCTNGATATSGTQTGMFLGDPTAGERSFAMTDRVQAGFIDQDGAHFFAFLARNGEYASLLRILDPEERPLGLHRLDDVWLHNITTDAGSAFYFSHDSNIDLARTGDGGLVLVTSAIADRADGLILFMNLQGPLGITDRYATSRFYKGR